MILGWSDNVLSIQYTRHCTRQRQLLALNGVSIYEIVTVLCLNTLTTVTVRGFCGWNQSVDIADTMRLPRTSCRHRSQVYEIRGGMTAPCATCGFQRRDHDQVHPPGWLGSQPGGIASANHNLRKVGVTRCQPGLYRWTIRDISSSTPDPDWQHSMCILR